MLMRIATGRFLPSVQARGFSAIPINKVARVYRCHVQDEASGAKLDEILKRAQAKFRPLPVHYPGVSF